jgi:hypothetical protein
LGEPGLSGEWISLLNRYKPPVGAPFILSLKAAAIGVGNVGIAGSLPFISLGLKVEFGVFGETSDPSSMPDTDKFRPLIFFKLDEEKFLRRPVLDWVRPGEPERGKPSLSFVEICVSCMSVGVGGDIISAGFGPGRRDEACRAIWGMGGRPEVPAVDGRCCEKPAVFGWTEELLSGTFGGGIDGGCVKGPFDAFEVVSILRSFAF